MKKFFSTMIVLFCMVIAANAQDAGRFWIGGSVGITNTSVQDGDDYLNFKFIPEFGYTVNDKIGLGIKLGFQQTELDLTGVSTRTQGFVVNPFLRYSVCKSNIGGIFIDGGIGYTYAKIKDSDVKSHDMEIGFRPGVAFNVSEKIALTAKFGFLGYEFLKVGDAKVHHYGFDFDLDQVLLGISFVF